jgi:hypothetical protein
MQPTSGLYLLYDHFFLYFSNINLYNSRTLLITKGELYYEKFIYCNNAGFQRGWLS